MAQSRLSSFQPSEAAKIAVIIFFHGLQNPGILKILDGTASIWACLDFAGLMLEPHFSGTVVLGLWGNTFRGGGENFAFADAHTGSCGGLAFGDIVGIQVERITALYPFRINSATAGKSYNRYLLSAAEAYSAWLGRSRQKFLYVPEPQ